MFNILPTWFLDARARHGEEKTGKGGYHWVYTTVMDESEFKRFIVETLLGNLKRDFPEETEKVLSKIK